MPVYYLNRYITAFNKSTADIVVTLIVKSLLEVNTDYYKFTATTILSVTRLDNISLISTGRLIHHIMRVQYTWCFLIGKSVITSTFIKKEAYALITYLTVTDYRWFISQFTDEPDRPNRYKFSIPHLQISQCYCSDGQIMKCLQLIHIEYMNTSVFK